MIVTQQDDPRARVSMRHARFFERIRRAQERAERPSSCVDDMTYLSDVASACVTR